MLVVFWPGLNLWHDTSSTYKGSAILSYTVCLTRFKSISSSLSQPQNYWSNPINVHRKFMRLALIMAWPYTQMTNFQLGFPLTFLNNVGCDPNSEIPHTHFQKVSSMTCIDWQKYYDTARLSIIDGSPCVLYQRPTTLLYSSVKVSGCTTM